MPLSVAPGRGLVSLAVFGLILAVYLVSPVIVQSDSIWTVPTVASLLSEGNANLDEYRPTFARQSHGVLEVDGHAYNYFPLGPALAALPLIGLYDGLVHLWNRLAGPEYPAGGRWEERFHQSGDVDLGHFRRTERLVASFYVSLSALVLFLAARRRLALAPALGLVAIYAFGTSAWSSASRVLWQHGPAMFANALVVYLLTRPERRTRHNLALGVAAAFSYCFRPTNALTVAGVFGLLAWRHRRELPAFVGGLLVVLLPFGLYNLSVYGAALPPYYAGGRLELGTGLLLEAMAGNLISPARGLFIWSPVLVFAVASGLVRAVRGKLSETEVLLGLILGAHWVAISAFPHWWGGHSTGPRFFCDVLPYLVWLLGPVLAGLSSPGRWRWGRVAPVALAAAFSFFVHGRAATRFEVHRWNDGPPSVDEAPERVWDWQDPQVLRGAW